MIVMEKPLLNSDNSEETSTDLHRNKDSLDRFDDSLCVLLLPYLPFKDLIRLECVSKQFQTVTKSALTDHKTLVIDDDLMGPKGCAIHVNRLMNEIKRLCPHIERIDVHGYKRQNKIIGQLNSTNFPRLTQVYCDFSKLCNIGAQLWIELGQYITGVEFYRIEEAFFRPIDPKMAAMRVINKRRDLLKYFKNISFMRVRNLEQVFDKTTGKLSFNSLKGFEIIFNEVAHLKLWSEFVKGNNSLKYVSMEDATGDEYLSKAKEVDPSITQIVNFAQFAEGLSQLSQLKILSLGINSSQITEDSLKLIGKNCKQLTKFQLEFFSKDHKLDDNIFESLQDWPRLKQVIIRGKYFTKSILSELKHCAQLELLSLDTNVLNIDSLFGDKLFPRLKDLYLNGSNISITTLSCIAKLPVLKTLNINGSYYYSRDAIEKN